MALALACVHLICPNYHVVDELASGICTFHDFRGEWVLLLAQAEIVYLVIFQRSI